MPYGLRNTLGRHAARPSRHARRYRYAPAFASPRYCRAPVERFSYAPNARKANRNLAMTAVPFAVLWYAAPLFMAGLLGFGFLCGLLGPVVQCALAERRRGIAAAERAQKAMRIMHRASRREPPSRELLLRCWELSRDSLEGKILLGSLLGDVDAVEDHSYIRGDSGEIVGRRGGVRRWLEATCPVLMKHYKTLMRYKAMADKFRRVCGLGDPDSAEDALAAGEPDSVGISDVKSQISDFRFHISAVDTRKVDGRFAPTPAAMLATARKRARELLAAHRTAKALDDALWAALGLVRTRRRPVAA